MANSWITRVKRYAVDNGVSFKEALQACKGTHYGGSQFAGYVRRLEAEKKITNESFQKIKNPSQWLINKYGNRVVQEPAQEPVEIEVPPQVSQKKVKQLVEQQAHPSEVEPQYDDINVSEIKNVKRKRKKQKELISDDEADEIAEQQMERNDNKSKLDEFQNRIKRLIKNLNEYNRRSKQMKMDYTSDLSKLKKLKQTKKNVELYEQRIQQNVQDKKDLLSEYPELVKYCKDSNLDITNFGEVFTYMTQHLKNIKKMYSKD